MHYKNHIILFFVFLAGISCYAQEDFEFKRFNIEDGLSHTHVLSIAQDTMGYLWIGTYNGLNKFDGKNFKTYFTDPNDSTSIPSNVVHDIYVDKKGILWFSTERGFCSYNRNEDNFRNYNMQPPENYEDIYEHIRSIVRDNYGNLWLGTYRSGLVKYNIKEDNYTWYQHDSANINSITSNKINEIFIDTEERLWICHEFGNLSYFNLPDMQITKFANCYEGRESYYGADQVDRKSFPCINGDVITGIHQDSKQDFWISTWSSGFAKYNESNNEFEYFIPKNKNKEGTYFLTVRDLISIDEKLIVGTYGGGISIFNKQNKQFQSYFQKSESNTSLSQNLVWKLFIDNTNNLWVGTFEGGLNMTPLNKLQSILFTGFSNKKINIENVLSTFEDHENNVWIGTQESGIFKINYQEKSVENIFIDTLEVGINKVNSIVQDRDNRLWFGTDYGILKYDTKSNKFTHYSSGKNKSLNSSNAIKSILADKNGNIWIGYFANGVNVIPYYETFKEVGKAKIKSYLQEAHKPNSLSSNFIEIIYEDIAGSIWVGSKGALDKFDADNDQFDQIFDLGVYVMNEDSYGYLWFDSYSGSLTRYNQGNGDVIPRFSSEPVHNIEEYNNKLWFTSEMDVYTYDLITKQTINLTEASRFPSLHFRPNSSVKLKNNTILIGASEGFIQFHPDSISTDLKNQQVYIKNIFIQNQLVKINEKIKNTVILDKAPDVEDYIVIPSSVKTFSIEFGSNEFNSPDLERYAFILEGFDTTWTHTSALNNKATFTNLDGGKYVFKVSNTTGKSNWEDDSKSLIIRVIPPYYKTLWFKIALLLFIITVVSVIWFIRMTNIKKTNIYLEKQVRLRTRELERQTYQLNETNAALEERQQQVEEQSEEMHSQKEVLAELNATKDKLFSIVAHDLKNPVGNLMGFLELLKINFDTYPPEKTKDIVNSLFDSTEETYNLLTGLLDWSRVQQGTISFNPVMADINAIISETINILKGQASNKNIQINNNSVGDFNVLLDPDLINAVLRNLISNAIKFTNENGNIKISCINDNGHVLVSIVDDGIGMPREVAENIFKKGNHYTSYGTNGEKGTGLGLSTVKDFIAIHNGKVWVESEEGKGSRFYFTFPVTNS